MKLFRAELHITPDKKLCYASPKLPSATSFIRKTIGNKTIGKMSLRSILPIGRRVCLGSFGKANGAKRHFAYHSG
ncbi:MAG: hypothetical protein U9R01_00740 [candidate division WOR-3 bacterium]|nr:hypothetical protein [candidate division WOR-3 bacterium]